MDDAQSGPLVTNAGARAPGEHTPGPWTVRPKRRDDWGYIRAANGWPVAIARTGRDVTEEELDECRRLKIDPTQANADLIAAAPDLLAALKAVVADIEDYERVNSLYPNPGRTSCWDSVARAKIAIAKALGARAEASPPDNPTARHIIPDPPR